MIATNTVLTVPSLATATNDIRDIKPPIEIPNYWMFVWLALAVLVIVAVVVAVLAYFMRRRRLVAVHPPILPAHVRAKQKLQEALALITQPKPFCTMVSDTIRFYLEERFEFHAPERTTEEFLYELRSTNLLTPDQKDSLGGFLQSCDLVKFAKYEPGEAELRDLHNSALRLVEETEPVQAEAAGENRESGSREETGTGVIRETEVIANGR